MAVVVKVQSASAVDAARAAALEAQKLSSSYASQLLASVLANASSAFDKSLLNGVVEASRVPGSTGSAETVSKGKRSTEVPPTTATLAQAQSLYAAAA